MLKLASKTSLHLVSRYLPQNIMGHAGKNSNFTEISEATASQYITLV